MCTNTAALNANQYCDIVMVESYCFNKYDNFILVVKLIIASIGKLSFANHSRGSRKTIGVHLMALLHDVRTFLVILFYDIRSLRTLLLDKHALMTLLHVIHILMTLLRDTHSSC